MEMKELKRVAKEWYESISRNRIVRVTKSKKFPDTVTLAVEDPQGRFQGYVWIRHCAPEKVLLLQTEIGTHGMKHLT